METPRARLLQAAAELVRQISGEVPASLSVIVRHEGGEHVITPRPGELDRAAVLDTPRRQVLAAVAEGEAPTGAEIARRTGYTPGGWFNQLLADMRVEGLLGGQKGAPGYPRGPRAPPP